MLDAIHWDALLSRLSMDMLIYAWQSIVRRAGNEELTKIRASIEEAIRRAEEVYNEMGSRYGLRDNK
jgi:ribosomal protein L20A (L18A)